MLTFFVVVVVIIIGCHLQLLKKTCVFLKLIESYKTKQCAQDICFRNCWQYCIIDFFSLCRFGFVDLRGVHVQIRVSSTTWTLRTLAAIWALTLDSTTSYRMIRSAGTVRSTWRVNQTRPSGSITASPPAAGSWRIASLTSTLSSTPTRPPLSTTMRHLPVVTGHSRTKMPPSLAWFFPVLVSELQAEYNM